MGRWRHGAHATSSCLPVASALTHHLGVASIQAIITAVSFGNPFLVGRWNLESGSCRAAPAVPAFAGRASLSICGSGGHGTLGPAAEDLRSDNSWAICQPGAGHPPSGRTTPNHTIEPPCECPSPDTFSPNHPEANRPTHLCLQTPSPLYPDP